RTVTLKSEHRITGRVTDTVTGRPIPAFTIIPINVFRKDWLSAERGNAKAGQGGRLDFLATRTDTPLRLRVEAPGYRSQTGPEVPIDQHAAGTLRLRPWASVRGQFRDGGQSVRGATVFLQPIHIDSLDRPRIQDSVQVVTDPDGGFEFPRVPSGPVCVRVYLGP